MIYFKIYNKQENINKYKVTFVETEFEVWTKFMGEESNKQRNEIELCGSQISKWNLAGQSCIKEKVVVKVMGSALTDRKPWSRLKKNLLI